jgi:hypothetical protein
MSGLLVDSETAAANSAAATALRKTKQRTVKDPPTQPRHLNNKIVNRKFESAHNEVMAIADVTQPQPGVDLGMAYSDALLITKTNVPRAGKNGGGPTNLRVLEEPLRVITYTGTLASLNDTILTLQNLRDLMVENGTQSSNTPLTLGTDTTVITSRTQLNFHRTNNSREKARTATEEETTELVGLTPFEVTF